MPLYFEERGDKAATTIVFVHGGGTSGWMWGKQLEYFKDYHCLVPDLMNMVRILIRGKFPFGLVQNNWLN